MATGIDWFELKGEVSFEGQTIPFPQLLASIRKAENLIRLGDGSFGVLPDEWLEKYSTLARFGSAKKGRVSFTRSQAGLLDAMLAGLPDVETDKKFQRIRDELAKFEGIPAMSPSRGFSGALREYQKEGLGWFYFLRKLEGGGCLADDMGLGKTVQVLALFQTNRISQKKNRIKGPHLIVMPRSLLFNWEDEAQKFTPQLKVLIYSGPHRKMAREKFGEFDLIITTYGTLRRDIGFLANYTFGYIVLDEAQAIKNIRSQVTKASRLLKGRYRLALSGTPIENHIGELWSLFEFLNPGMLGKDKAFSATKSEAELEMLRRALRPFILRRTKGQVAKELPDKMEQVIYCEMKPPQKRVYEELKKYYRASLKGKVNENGLGGSQMHILEALLRLRQAACHPGLVNKEKQGETSAKLESLWNQLAEIVSEGHKVLVFSQFTQLLSLVRRRLEQEGMAYLYLDGRTRKRGDMVKTFQEDGEYPVFLISLKAGGLGLNLTAADYVFILDPWWNPAVESQAIDRAHRMGQTKKVFAYRLISRDTVEEKVLELQDKKRELVGRLISEEGSALKNLSAEDLNFLLS